MRRASVLLLLLLLSISAGAHAQPVQGRLLERESSEPLVGGTVHLLDADSQVVAQALSDEGGVFAMQAPSAGRYFLAARAPGYELSTTDYFDVGEQGRRVAMMIGRSAVRLETLTVEARAGTREDRLWYGGFYRRMREGGGGGRFMAREQVDEARPTHVADLLRRFPSLEVSHGADGGVRMLVRLRQPLSISSRCLATFYLNGMRVEPESIDGLDPRSIEGIEVYAIGVPPAQFSGANAACGVIAIWLRAR